MTTESTIPVEERIGRLLQHLDIEQAHFAARSLGDLTGLAANRPELFASLTLVSPAPPNREIIGPLASRLLVFRGDTDYFDRLGKIMETLPEARLVTAHNYEPWTDFVARYVAEIESVMLPFLASKTPASLPEPAIGDGERGVVADITYEIRGSGPPLVLMPLGLIPSQWDPLIPQLSQRYSTIVLGGDKLGITALLEERAASAGYLGMIRYLVQEANVQPGESILEVGCGTGALGRWLAGFTEGQNPITGVDINRYLLREAKNLAHKAGMELGRDSGLKFEEGDAEALPYPDNAFDLVMSSTLLEEVDASKALAEMIRVARPGGRVAAIVRANDVRFFINVPLGDELKARIEDPEEWVTAGPRGCADASLYRKFQESVLTKVKMFPHLATFSEPWIADFVEDSFTPHLDESEAADWRAARAEAEAAGTFFFSYAHHCALGTKPA